MLGLAIWTGLAVPIHAQSAAIDLSMIGGPVPASILSYRPKGACVLEPGAEDCLVVSPSGVEFVVFEGTICRVTMDAGRMAFGEPLPFGLRFGDTKTGAISKLPTNEVNAGKWNASDRRDVYSASLGDPDDMNGLYLSFEAGGLSRFEAQSTCV